MAVQSAALVSVEEYLSSSYEPDCDYVDGVLEERNLGEREHSRLQLALARYLGNRERQWNVWILPEQRIRIGPRRFRVPDLCVILRDREIEQVPTKPPLVCIEILSPEDRVVRIQARVDDYLNFGVAYVWVVNPADRRVWVYTSEGSREVKDRILATENPSLTVDLSEIYAGIDEEPR